MNIYESLNKPLYSLAPMEEVTDSVFRRVISSVGRPDLYYTEFVNVEGLTSVGRDSVIHRLRYDVEEKPIIAQLWGVTPDCFYKAAQTVSDLGFDGVDINMGCSVNKVAITGAGSAFIKSDPSYVKDVIDAVKDGCNGLSVSVKTRIGWDTPDTERWIGFLLNQDISALSIHGRTARGDGALHADWNEIYKGVQLRNAMQKKTLVFGNGDIKDMYQARQYVEKYQVDGVMIGRAAMTNPWIFSDKGDVTNSEKIELFKLHLNLFKDTWGNAKNFHSLKKFFRSYINNFEGATEIRNELMDCNSVEEVLNKLETVNIL